MEFEIWETDFEPDDVLFMRARFARLPPRRYVAIVLGESEHPEYKAWDLLEFITRDLAPDTFHHTFRIYLGAASSKRFPYRMPPGDNPVPVVPWPVCDLYDPLLHGGMGDYGTGIVCIDWYGVKPPRELFARMLSGEDMSALRNVNAHMYGSFNFRTLKESAENIQRFMSLFKRFDYYDTKTCIGDDTSYQLPKPDAHCERWNMHVLADCYTDLEHDTPTAPPTDLAVAATLEESRRRTQKIIDSVTGNEKTQVLMADPLAALAPVPDMPASLASWQLGGYPTWRYEPGSTVFVYGDLSDGAKARRREIVVDAIASL